MKLEWIANERYEIGVDRGVMFTNYTRGVAWNGIVSVEEAVLGSEKNERYIDGVKYMEDIGSKNYQATMKVYSKPLAFNDCIGVVDIVPGFSLTNQPTKRFHLTYRTRIADLGYKIHIVYNLTATEDGSSNATLTGSSGSTPKEFTIKLDAVPPPSSKFKPTAHFVIDTTKTPKGTLDLLEAMLYGTTNAEPTLPTPDELMSLFNV